MHTLPINEFIQRLDSKKLLVQNIYLLFQFPDGQNVSVELILVLGKELFLFVDHFRQDLYLLKLLVQIFVFQLEHLF